MFLFRHLLLLMLTFLFLPFAPAHGQERYYHFDEFEIASTKDGSVLSNLTHIFQDSKGFMWFGAYSGLYRFDGQEVIHYRNDPEDSLSIGDNKIGYIREDKENYLWVITQNSLERFDPRTGTFRHFSSKGHFEQPIAQAGHFGYLSTPPGQPDTVPAAYYQFNSQENDFIRKDLPSKASITEKDYYWRRVGVRVKSGIIWVLKNNQIIRYDPLKESLKSYPVQNLDNFFPATVDILEDQKGRIWVRFFRHPDFPGLYYYDPEKEELVFFDLSPEDQEVGWNRTLDFIQTKNGDFWVLTDAGIVRHSPSDSTFLHLKPGGSNNNLQEVPFYIMEDQSGLIWLGDFLNNKLAVYNPRKEKIISYPFWYTPDPGISTYTSFLELASGKLLFWEEKGLKVLDWNTGDLSAFPYQPDRYAEYWKQGLASFMRDHRGRIWMGSGRGGLICVLDPKTMKWEYFINDSEDPTSLSPRPVREMIEDSRGEVWSIHMGGGVSRIDPESREIHRYPLDGEFFNEQARSIYEDRSGVIWVGTRGGLNRYERESDSFTNFHHEPGDPTSMSESTAFDILEDEDGNLWIGTYGGGLNKFDRETETFSHYTVEDGLTDNNILSLLPDDRGHIWMSTFNGISRLDPKTMRFTRYYDSDGLINTSYGAFSYFKSRLSGFMVFGGIEGFDIFHPDSLTPDPNIPPVELTGLLLQNKEVPVAKSEAERSSKDTFYLPVALNELEELELKHHQNVITFKYAALYYASPAEAQYA